LAGLAPPLECALSDEVRAKDVIIVPHELAEYDALGRDAKRRDNAQGASHE
jgi:hypothetical protein